MRKKRLCLVDNRFTAINYPDRIRIIELMESSDSRRVRILQDVETTEPHSDDQACRMTLEWLYKNGYISRLEFFQHAEQFLTQASMGPLEALKPGDEESITEDSPVAPAPLPSVNSGDAARRRQH
jgi:hypothetical protein